MSKSGGASRSSGGAGAARKEPTLSKNGKPLGRPRGSGGSSGSGASGAAPKAQTVATLGKLPKAGDNKVFYDSSAGKESTTPNAKFQQASRETFGHVLSDAEVAGLVGAQPGDEVGITATRYDYGGSVGKKWMFHLGMEGKGGYGMPGGYGNARAVMYDDHGQLMMYNHKFYIHEQTQGQGIGTAVFTRQAATARRLGIKYIATSPATSRAESTWKKMGYKWVKQDGGRSLHFDLAPKSASWQHLESYLATRAARPAGARSRVAVGTAKASVNAPSLSRMTHDALKTLARTRGVQVGRTKRDTMANLQANTPARRRSSATKPSAS